MKDKNNTFFFICKSFKHMLQSLEGIKFFKTFKITQKMFFVFFYSYCSLSYVISYSRYILLL